MKRFILIYTIASLSVSFLQAQEKIIERGDIYFSKKEYFSALKNYKSALRKEKNNPALIKKIADCYLSFNKTYEAENYYALLSNKLQTSDSIHFTYAQILKKNGKYDAAKSECKKLLSLHPENSEYKNFLYSCDSSEVWSKFQSEYAVENIGSINTEFSDITPAAYKNGISFASNKEEVIIRKKSETNNEPYFNIYFSEEDTVRKKFRSPKLFSSNINTDYHETAPSFTKDYKKIYFSRCKDSQGKDIKDTVNRIKLFSSEMNNGKWSSPHKFVFNDSTCSYGHPSIEANEKMFFFASDMKGGYGGVDIYVCLNIDNKWTNPINLGPGVNTAGDEIYPFYHVDGSLYFASDFHTGLGGFDIFNATEANGDWGNITNLKTPINSSSDDFSIYFNEDRSKGYFTSNRFGGKGAEDIYKIYKSKSP